MRSFFVACWSRHMVSAAATGFALSLSCAAEARGGSGGMGGFHGGAGLGAFSGGSFGQGGIVAAPGRAVSAFGSGLRGSHQFRHHGVPLSAEIIVVPRRSRPPHYNAIGIPPLVGTAVPPFTGTTVRTSGGAAAQL